MAGGLGLVQINGANFDDNGSLQTKLVGGNGFSLEPLEDGSVPFTNSLVVPPNYTKCREASAFTVTKNGGISSEYLTVPTNADLNLQRLTFTGYIDTDTLKQLQERLILYWQEDGTDVNEVEVARLYLQGMSKNELDLDIIYSTGGVSRFRIAVKNQAGDIAEVYVILEGYYQ
jgi:hypothetical protein